MRLSLAESRACHACCVGTNLRSCPHPHSQLQPCLLLVQAACLDYLPVDDEFLEPEGELPSLGLLPPLCPGLESLEVHSSRAVLSLDSFAGLTALTELSLLGSRCYPVDPTSLCLLLQAVGRLPQLAKLRGVAHLHEAAAASREGRAAFEALLHSRPQLVLKCFGWHGN